MSVSWGRLFEGRAFLGPASFNSTDGMPSFVSYVPGNESETRQCSCGTKGGTHSLFIRTYVLLEFTKRLVIF